MRLLVFFILPDDLEGFEFGVRVGIRSWGVGKVVTLRVGVVTLEDGGASEIGNVKIVGLVDLASGLTTDDVALLVWEERISTEDTLLHFVASATKADVGLGESGKLPISLGEPGGEMLRNVNTSEYLTEGLMGGELRGEVLGKAERVRGGGLLLGNLKVWWWLLGEGEGVGGRTVFGLKIDSIECDSGDRRDG